MKVSDFSYVAGSRTAVQGDVVPRLVDGFQRLIDTTGIVFPSLVLGLVLLALIYHDRVIFTPGKRKEMFHPGGAWPLVGHTPLIVKRGIQNQLENFKEVTEATPTGTWRMTFFGPGSLIMVNRPEYLEYIQKVNFENYPKGIQFRDRLGDLLGHDGIFVADGDIWKTQRKAASHMFSARQFNIWVKSVVHGELNAIDEMLANVVRQKNFQITGDGSTAGPGASGTGGMISMPELFFRYTLSSFTKMAFAADLDCLTADPSSLDKPVPFAVAFDFSQGVLNERFVTPGWKFIEKFSKQGRKMRESIKVIREFGMAIIKQRLVEENGGVFDEKNQVAMGHQAGFKRCELQNDGKDLLALFMEHTRDPEALLTVVLNFLIAGRDTTAQTLSWLFYELCANPEHVEHIRSEVDSVLGADAASNKAWLKYEDVKKLPYTLACIHEAARLHPAVPKNGKEVLKDDIIVPQGPNPQNLPPLKVYKGERVFWSDWVMNRSVDVWGPDAALFNPQRFLQKDEKGGWTYAQHSQWKFHVFNAGPRLCLGMNLANFEAVAFTAATLQKYDFTWASNEQGQTSQWPPTYANSVTHPMKDPYMCIVTSRK